MATRGRKPKGRIQRIAEGNPGRRPMNDREPEFEQKAPECPEHLPEEAKREWDRRVAELSGAGVVAPCHVAVLCAYC